MLELVINAERPAAAINEFTADAEHQCISGDGTGGKTKATTDRISIANRGLPLALKIMPIFGTQARCGQTKISGVNRFGANAERALNRRRGLFEKSQRVLTRACL